MARKIIQISSCVCESAIFVHLLDEDGNVWQSERGRVFEKLELPKELQVNGADVGRKE